MLQKHLCLSLTAALLASMTVGPLAQTLPQSIEEALKQQQPDTYIPLFTPEQIAKASKKARKRMQATEKMNHDAWMNRSQKSAEAKAQKEATARATQKPAAPRYTRKGKIYKWVDAQGRIHFGDAPKGKDSKQIKLRNIRPAEGAPPPATAPHLLKSGEDD